MILVTGATGFVGRRVVEALVVKGRRVRALAHTDAGATALSSHDVELVRGDVLDPPSLVRACEGVETVVHLVAVVRERRDFGFRRVNYEGTRNVLHAATAAGVGRFVHVSTLGTGSDPAFPYLYSRWMAEQEVERAPMPHTIVRFSVGFGEGDEFFNILAALVKVSPVVPVAGDGTARFQPIAVEDIARCLVMASEEDGPGRTVDVGGPHHLTYDQMLDIVAETLGTTIAKVHVPMPLMRPAVTIMEALMPHPPATREQLKMLQIDNTTELKSVKTAFGFDPTPMAGNIDYVSGMGLGDALKLVFLGRS